jgi:hypothetical protein
MDVREIVVLTVGLLIVLVPILAVSARLALRPIIDSILKLHQAFAPAISAERVARLEREIAEIKESMRRIEEAERFHAQLRNPERIDVE